MALPDGLGVGNNDTVLPVVPVFHASAWGLPFACPMTGADLVLPGPRLDAVSVLDLLELERVTMTAGMPTVWMAVQAAIDAEPRRWDLSALRRIVVGGSAVPPAVIDGFDRHRLEILQAWGMTETSPLGTTSHLPRDFGGESTASAHTSSTTSPGGSCRSASSTSRRSRARRPASGRRPRCARCSRGEPGQSCTSPI